MDQLRVERFRSVYESNYPRISAYIARRVFSPEDAADVLAETFLTAWRRFETVPAGEQATPWLFATARRLVANHRRAAQRRASLEQKIAGERPRVGASEETGEAGEAFSRLSIEDQDLLGLIAWDGLSYRELGAVLGCSENAAKLRSARARRRFAANLGRPARPRLPRAASSISRMRHPTRLEEN